jgi:hypothetical protein
LLSFQCVFAAAFEPIDFRELVGKATAGLDDMEPGSRESDFGFPEHGYRDRTRFAPERT